MTLHAAMCCRLALAAIRAVNGARVFNLGQREELHGDEVDGEGICDAVPDLPGGAADLAGDPRGCPVPALLQTRQAVGVQTGQHPRAVVP